jgi:hypothetical protein
VLGAPTFRRTMADPAARPALISTLLAVVLAVAYLAAPLMGGDLSAQLAHADFARQHPLTPVDLRWFGGSLPFGYSLWVPAVTAWLGARVVGALATIAATYLTTRLFQRVGARRPLLGGLLAAACQASDLAEGRIAFASGTALGLAALLAVLSERRGRAAICAVLAGAANPVAALLLWLCGGTAILGRRYRDGAVLLVASALPVAVISGIFADGGHQVFDATDALRAGLVSVLVAVVVPHRYRMIRIGAGLGVLMVIAAYAISTPVGGNATRLSLLFAVPVIAAFIERGRIVTSALVLLAVAVQTPVTVHTLTDAGAPATKAAYYTSVLAQIQGRGTLTGRVEIPELTGHWDAVYAARQVPLARGWLRQVDTDLNGGVFYDRLPTATSYRSFLDANAVEYVAVPDARLTFYGKRETRLINTKLAYLTDVWHDSHWTLYAVQQPAPIVAAPGTLVSYTADTVRLTAPAGSTVHLNVRWFDWLSATGAGCIERDGRDGRDTTVRVRGPGPVVVSSGFSGGGHC